MRKMGVVLASVALAMVALFLGSYSGPAGSMRKAKASTAPTQPNFVFILADDMRKDDLSYMPKTRALLQDKGMSFANDYVSNPLCCPSRSTIMRGEYEHNLGVWANGNGPDGGWEGYRTNGGEQDNIATLLHAAGYRTGLIGKYLNYYDGSEVPQGWDDWFATFDTAKGQAGYYDYDVNDNGTIRHYGTLASDYNTDVIKGQTRQFIGASVARSKPFFAYVAPKATHAVPIPAPRDEHTYDGLKAPRPPSFNEEDVSDKPPWISSLPPLTSTQIAHIDKTHEKRAETLQALDDLVAGVVNKLRNSGQLDHTYIFLTSDNGWEQGEHRIESGKKLPYQEDVNMPLLARGPGVQAGSTTDKLAINTDFFPTFTDLAGLQTPGYVDGRSLRPIIKGRSTTWRSSVLLEARHTSTAGDSAPVTYNGIRTSDDRKYVEYADGPRELYDLATDPYELTNIYDPNLQPPDLASRLQALESCAGNGCFTAENGP